MCSLSHQPQPGRARLSHTCCPHRSLGLTLRLWDVYLLEGQVLMPIRSIAFKVQKSKSMCTQWGLGSPAVRPDWPEGSFLTLSS